MQKGEKRKGYCELKSRACNAAAVRSYDINLNLIEFQTVTVLIYLQLCY